MSTPIPSTLVAIACLPMVPAHAKVRILGCITSNNTSHGFITLTHNITSTDLKSAITAFIPVYQKEQLRLLKLEEANNNNNIPGDTPSDGGSGKKTSSKRRPPKVKLDQDSVDVQIDVLLPSIPSFRPKEWVNVMGYKQEDGSIKAIMLWKVEDVDLVQYEQAMAVMLEQRLKDGRQMAEVRDI